LSRLRAAEWRRSPATGLDDLQETMEIVEPSHVKARQRREEEGA
jgi:hypothetical protein